MNWQEVPQPEPSSGAKISPEKQILNLKYLLAKEDAKGKKKTRRK